MKDATGELSMTAVAVVAIAAISVVFSTLIWPNIRATIMRSTYCSQAFGCDPSTNQNGMVTCYYCPSQKNTGSESDVGSDCSTPSQIQCNQNQQGS